jgi:hypothetical protein
LVGRHLGPPTKEPTVKALLLVALIVLATPARAQTHVPFDATSDVRHKTVASEYPQDETYAKWWKEVAQCEGLTLPDSATIAKVKFYVVPVARFSVDVDTLSLIAASDTKAGEVYVSSTNVWNESTIKHEMLHHEMQWAGFKFPQYHPVELFATCGIKVYGDSR